MRGKRAILSAAVLVGVLAIGVVGYRLVAGGLPGMVAQDAQGAGTAGGSEEPTARTLADYDATVYTELGEPMKLSAIADGKPLVINFWATWCPYCVEELPDFQELVSEYGDRVNFAFVDVTGGNGETVDGASKWLAENGFSDLPAYYDTSLEATANFGASALPTTVVVSAEGEVLTITAGRIDPTLMRGALDSVV